VYKLHNVTKPKKKKKKKKIESDLELELDLEDYEMGIIDDHDDDDFLLFSIENTLTNIRKKYPKLKITSMQYMHILHISVAVTQTPFAFTLKIDTSIRTSNIIIEFTDPRPDEIFIFLLERHKYFNSGSYNIEFEKIITFVSSSLVNDIEIDKGKQKFDINDKIEQMYILYDITIEDYMWQGPSQTCPREIDDSKNRLMLMAIEEMAELIIKNIDDVKTNHVYKLYPIINYYVQIHNIDIMINNILHYNFLAMIIKALWQEYSMNTDSVLGTIIKVYKNEESYALLDDNIKDTLNTFELSFD
jgi:hypothetical protein